jgi:hypothetical protein
MLASIVRFLRHNAIALLALAVALGGTAYASSQIGARDLKPIQVRATDANLRDKDDKTVRAKCRNGEVLLGGTWQFDAPPFLITEGHIQAAGASYLEDKRGPFMFEVEVANDSGEAVGVDVSVLCLKR